MSDTVINTYGFKNYDNIYEKLQSDTIFNLLLMDDEGGLRANFVDEEGDLIECDFNNDDCITLNTENLTYMVLDRWVLERMIKLIDESTSIYKKLYKKIDKNPDIPEEEVIKKFKKEYEKSNLD